VQLESLEFGEKFLSRRVEGRDPDRVICGLDKHRRLSVDSGDEA
jgi:hypothetical protein